MTAYLKKLEESTSNINDTNDYTTDWYKVYDYNNVVALAYADESLDIKIQFSQDGSNVWGEDSFSTTASEGEGIEMATFGQYARAIFENNSGTNTDTCRVALIGKRVNE